MSEERTSEDGRSWVGLSTLAGCFECELSWVETVYHHGLLGEGISRSGTVLVQTRYLEEFAVVYRMTVYYGLDLETVELLLARK
ncbi:MAG: hypothetical protein ACI8TX_002346 [Hyphomicrobiaceae bacterium]